MSKLLGFGASMNSDIVGYIGSDTIPSCKKGLCWYLYVKPFKITQAQLDSFKVKGVEANARGTNFSTDARWYSKILYTKATEF